MPITTPHAEIRPPWPDELWRVKHFLPLAFLYDADPWLRVAVRGRSERLAGALGLSFAPLRPRRAGWVCLRVEPQPERLAIMEALLQPALAAAWEAGAHAVGFGQTVAADSPDAGLLQRMGFAKEETLELYEAEAGPLWRRLDRIHRRLRARGAIPPGVELTPLQPGVIERVRRFLCEHLPQSLSTLALESAGYKPEHSLALWVGGELKGVLLARRVGKESHTGLRVVAPELRGGLAWANFLLLHASTGSGVRSGMERSRFELNPRLHDDTRQLAATLGANLIRQMLLLRIERPENRRDESGMG